jgi:hypothetical protein
MTSVGKARMARVRNRAAQQPRTRTPAPPGSTTARGYGWSHQQERARQAPLVESGRAVCWRCRKPIRPGQPWDLGHHDHDRSRYTGPEHAACNRRAAAQSKARRRMSSHRRPAPALEFFNTTGRH